MALKVFEILDKNGFTMANGEWHELHSNIDQEEAEFLHKLITELKPKKSLEIGCAEGISSMVICESIGPDAHHTILDPFQSTDWKNNGINNLKNAGFNNFELFEQRSEFALPKMVEEGKKFDFVFVDGWHTFDHVLVEFFYINRMLNVGGIVAFDDVALTGLNRLMRWIYNYPNYECLGSVGDIPATAKRKQLNKVKKFMNNAFSALGQRVKEEVLHSTVIHSDEELGLTGSVAAFKKTAEDDRDWAWYKPF